MYKSNMSKIRVYIEPSRITDFIKISEMGVVHKVKNVLRLNEGDELFIFDGAGNEYSALIKYLQHDGITLRLGSKVRETPYPGHQIALAFPLTKEEKIDLILQKATELGATAFFPFIANRGLKVNPSEAKVERWQNIVKEACRQSERLWLPVLHPAQPLSEIVTGNYDKKIFADIAGIPVDTALPASTKNILLIVGPEGDFSPEEKTFLKDSGFMPVNIGPNILRLETAAIFITGLTSYFLETNNYTV